MTATNLQTLSFTLTLHGNLILSQSSATAGQHQSLDYIPGAALLGVAAGRLYSSLSASAAETLFHSGRVRFTDALPVGPQQQPGWPVPLCWHHLKGSDYQAKSAATGANCLLSTALFDPSRHDAPAGKQPKQLRAGYVTASGDLLLPERDFEMKTAIDAESGRAAESQLFGYQSLRKGQTFSFQIVADADIDSTLLDQLRSALTGEASIGRSRSAQFGAVTIQPLSLVNPLPAEANNIDSASTLRLWLLSDLALLDENANPTLTPEPEQIGLPSGSRWLAEQSFLRVRSYSPFNAKRRCYDEQRQVISRGSVLVFDLSEPLSPDLQERLAWLGWQQAAGLGRCAVNPSLLAQSQPVFAESENTNVSVVSSAQNAEPAVTQPPASALVRYLQAQVGESKAAQEVEREASELVSKIMSALWEARRWLGLRINEPLPYAPNRTQWGNLRELAHRYPEPSQLLRALFEGDHAFIRVRDGQPTWGLALGPKERLLDRMATLLNAIADQPRFADIVALTATRLMQQVDKVNVTTMEAHKS